jgi:hypothetical protein
LGYKNIKKKRGNKIMKGEWIPWEENHNEIDGVLYKKCTECNKWFPCTSEYFHKHACNKKDGLFPYCKPCNIKQATGHNRKYDKIENYRKWQNNNKDKIKQYREQRELHGDHKVNRSEWESCKRYFNDCCAYCGLPLEEHYNRYKGEMKLTDFHKEHVEHNGANDLSNCIPSCKTCNSSKHTDKLEDWYTKNKEFFSQERLDNIHKWLNEDYKIYIKESKSKQPYKKKDIPYWNDKGSELSEL